MALWATSTGVYLPLARCHKRVQVVVVVVAAPRPSHAQQEHIVARETIRVIGVMLEPIRPLLVLRPVQPVPVDRHRLKEARLVQPCHLAHRAHQAVTVAVERHRALRVLLESIQSLLVLRPVQRAPVELHRHKGAHLVQPRHQTCHAHRAVTVVRDLRPAHYVLLEHISPGAEKHLVLPVPVELHRLWVAHRVQPTQVSPTTAC